MRSQTCTGTAHNLVARLRAKCTTTRCGSGLEWLVSGMICCGSIFRLHRVVYYFALLQNVSCALCFVCVYFFFPLEIAHDSFVLCISSSFPFCSPSPPLLGHHRLMRAPAGANTPDHQNVLP